MVAYNKFLNETPIVGFRAFLENKLAFLGLSADENGIAYLAVVTGIIITLAIVSLVITKLILSKVITRLILRTRHSWDDALHNNGFFRRAGHLIPAIVLSTSSNLLLSPELPLAVILMRIAQLYMIVVGIGILFSIVDTIEDIYSKSRLAKRATITGFVQIAKLAFSIIGLLLSISVLINKSPVLLLSGLTAVAAVLLLIFRDTILGFVAGIQIAANRMFNTGDWIEMPKNNVNGEILEIGLTNVKVQNWDKTISTLPTYSLTNESVKNWRGMSESGGRRIKRAIYIDIQSVCLMDVVQLEQLMPLRKLQPYLEKKQQEIQQFHDSESISMDDTLNSRKLTNIGTFRAYLEAYLLSHPSLNHNMTTMVRQLKPTELGLPLEIYCFSADKRWVEYEKIQADIFDHIMAMLPVFGLRAYQRDLIRS